MITIPEVRPASLPSDIHTSRSGPLELPPPARRDSGLNLKQHRPLTAGVRPAEGPPQLLHVGAAAPCTFGIIRVFQKKKKKKSSLRPQAWTTLTCEPNLTHPSRVHLALKQKEKVGVGGEGTLPSCPELSRYSVRSQPKALAAPFRFSFCLAPLFFMS